MTPGQIITAAQIVAACAVVAVALARGNRPAMQAAGALIVALLLTRLLKAGLPPWIAPVAWAALWVTVGGWIAQAGMAARSRPVAAAGALDVYMQVTEVRY